MLENKDKKFGLIKDIAIIVIGVVLIWFAVKVVFNVDNPFYVVSSGSMIPVLNVGDILIVKDGNTFNSLKVGDIIVFNRPQGGDRVIVHRIIEISDRFGEKVIVTNTIPLRDHACELDKIKVLSIAPLLAKAIKSIHEETSVSSLFV